MLRRNAQDLRLTAREIFAEALRTVDARLAVQNAIVLDDEKLTIVDSQFDLNNHAGVFAVALGKAARPMAQALSEILGARIEAGVISKAGSRKAKGESEKMKFDALSRTSALRLSFSASSLPACWQEFVGGHPLPNAASFAAARAALALLKSADELSKDKPALVIFLVSGGGSALMELPREINGRRVSVSELRAANERLVGCGATIAEINAVRRAWSQIKGGGLSRAAGRSAQVSLIVSDTNEGDEANVASGPTLVSNTTLDPKEIIARYELAAKLPPSLLRLALQSHVSEILSTTHEAYTLLDNMSVLKSAARAAEARGFAVEFAEDIIETPIAEGCKELVERLLVLRKQRKERRGVCLISGGEFVCPVRGRGTGGRNAEAALRCAMEFDKQFEALKNRDDSTFTNQKNSTSPHLVALHAGTDGIDGNSPATGAISDETTLQRAAAHGLDAPDFLARSDAYTFFETLGDMIITGATETNVRDIRIMLAR